MLLPENLVYQFLPPSLEYSRLLLPFLIPIRINSLPHCIICAMVTVFVISKNTQSERLAQHLYYPRLPRLYLLAAPVGGVGIGHILHLALLG